MSMCYMNYLKEDLEKKCEARKGQLDYFHCVEGYIRSKWL